MSENICNPQTLIYNGAPVSNTNPLPCSSAAATHAPVSTQLLNPVTWLIGNAVVSSSNPIPITLV